VPLSQSAEGIVRDEKRGGGATRTKETRKWNEGLSGEVEGNGLNGDMGTFIAEALARSNRQIPQCWKIKLLESAEEQNSGG
jgi:hypothetical protein